MRTLRCDNGETQARANELKGIHPEGRLNNSRGRFVQVEVDRQETRLHHGDKRHRCTSTHAEGHEPDKGRSSEPESVSRIMSQKVRYKWRSVLLSNGKMSRTNLHPSATMRSSTSERPASRAGAMYKSRRVFSVLCSSSSEEVSSQQAHMARLRQV